MRSVLSSVLLAAGLSLSSAAVAQQEDPRKVQADKLMQEGAKLHEAYDAEGALTKLREAHATYPSANVTFALAGAEQFVGKNLDAIRHYREALRATTLHANNAQRGKEYIRQLEAKLGRIEVNAPPGALISVDGTRQEGTPTEAIDVEPGDHVVEASLGDRKKSATVHCNAGQLVAATIAFDDAPPPSTSPAQESKSSIWATPKVVGGSLAFLGAASAAIGAGFLIDSNNTATSADSLNAQSPGGACITRTPSCEAYRAQLDDASSSRTASYVGFAVGGALVVGAIAVFVFWRPPKETSATTRATMLARGLRFDF